MSEILRIGTRGSLLARAQTAIIDRALIALHPSLKIETIICTTSGDLIHDRPLHALGGKGLFTREIEQALIDNSIDVAIHSLKDLPITMPLVDESKLVIAAVPKREDPRDVLIASNRSMRIEDLPPRARVGTDSFRRRCQLLAIRPDLQMLEIRGNIDTRIAKLRRGEFDAIVLALAGLKRASLFDEMTMFPIPLDQVLNAAGQGALAIQCRFDDSHVRDLLASLNDSETQRAVEMERAIVEKLQGDCHSPIAALATIEGETVDFRAVVGARGGELPLIRAAASRDDPRAAMGAVFAQLDSQNALKLLHEAQDQSPSSSHLQDD